MRSDHTSAALRFAVPTVVDQGRKGYTGGSSPVIVRNEVEILIPTCLRLLLNHAEYLVDRRVPLVQVSNTVLRGCYGAYSFRS
jgi:hypothetical protein